MKEISKVDLQSKDIKAENIDKLRQLFPEIFTEGKIDFDKLKLTLGEEIDLEKEKYGMSWPGKARCFQIIQDRTTGTLKSVREESVDFDTTKNLFIEGDNLEVLKILQKSYFEKIKMIYIDPPYNTGKDFVYKDKFGQQLEEYLKLTNQVDSEGKKLSTNTDSDGRYHSNWMNMMYPRLYLARNLLREDGVIFISIDDHEVDNLKKICNEIFGEENFVGCAGRITKKSNNKGDYWAPNFDYLLTYVKNVGVAEEFFGDVNYDSYDLIEEDGPRKGEKYQLVRLYMSTIQNRNSEQRFWIKCPDGSKIIPPGKTFPPERPILGDGIWRWTRKKFEEEKDKIVIKKVRSSNLLNQDLKPAEWNVYTKTYLLDVINNSSAKPNSFIEDHINQIGSHELGELKIPFDYSKPSTLIKYLAEISKTKNNDIILDFFAGSATTAHAVLELNKEDQGNRKFICVQLPEATKEDSEAFKAGYKTISDIAKERIRRVIKKIKEEQKQQKLLEDNEQDLGFKVFKLDRSNFKTWDGFTKDIQTTLKDNIEQIKKSTDKEAILFEILLKEGFELTVPIKKIKIVNKDVYSIQDNQLLICLEEKLDLDLFKELKKLDPIQVVVLDKGFNENDQLKTNAVELLTKVDNDTNRKEYLLKAI